MLSKISILTSMCRLSKIYAMANVDLKCNKENSEKISVCFFWFFAYFVIKHCQRQSYFIILILQY